MSTTDQASAVDLDEIARSIAQAHPEVEYQAVRAEVERIAPRYAHATVTDFIPVLIEREVKANLRR